jgi:hypothetical protein
VVTISGEHLSYYEKDFVELPPELSDTKFDFGDKVFCAIDTGVMFDSDKGLAVSAIYTAERDKPMLLAGKILKGNGNISYEFWGANRSDTVLPEANTFSSFLEAMAYYREEYLNCDVSGEKYLPIGSVVYVNLNVFCNRRKVKAVKGDCPKLTYILDDFGGIDLYVHEFALVELPDNLKNTKFDFEEEVFLLCKQGVVGRCSEGFAVTRRSETDSINSVTISAKALIDGVIVYGVRAVYDCDPYFGTEEANVEEKFIFKNFYEAIDAFKKSVDMLPEAPEDFVDLDLRYDEDIAEAKRTAIFFT